MGKGLEAYARQAGQHFKITDPDCVELYNPYKKKCVDQMSKAGQQLIDLYKQIYKKRFLLQRELGTLEKWGMRQPEHAVFVSYLQYKWSDRACFLSNTLREQLGMAIPRYGNKMVVRKNPTSTSTDDEYKIEGPILEKWNEYHRITGMGVRSDLVWEVKLDGDDDFVSGALRLPLDMEELLNKCESAGKRFFIIEMELSNDYGGHANNLVVDFKLKTMERFDPHGETAEDYAPQALDLLLANSFQKFKYITASGFCVYGGPQREEQRQVKAWFLPVGKEVVDPLEGLCAAWSFWYIEMRLQYPDVPPKTLIEDALHMMHTNHKGFYDSIRGFIESYAKYVNQVILQGGMYKLRAMQGRPHHAGYYSPKPISKFHEKYRPHEQRKAFELVYTETEGEDDYILAETLPQVQEQGRMFDEDPRHQTPSGHSAYESKVRKARETRAKLLQQAREHQLEQEERAMYKKRKSEEEPEEAQAQKRQRAELLEEAPRLIGGGISKRGRKTTRKQMRRGGPGDKVLNPYSGRLVNWNSRKGKEVRQRFNL